MFCLNVCESFGLILIGNVDGFVVLLSVEVSYMIIGEIVVVNVWIVYEGFIVRVIVYGLNGNIVVIGGGDGVICVWYLVEE